jgi:hypothetical protein
VTSESHKPTEAVSPSATRANVARIDSKVFIPFVSQLWCESPMARYSKRDQKLSIDSRYYSLAVVDLESLYSYRRAFAEKPIGSAGIVAAISQSNLDFSDDRRVGSIYRSRSRRHLLIGTSAQGNSDSDQKHEPGYFRHTSFSTLINAPSSRLAGGPF